MVSSFRTSTFIISVFLSLAFTACAQPGCDPNVGVILPDTEVKSFKASATGRDYDIYIRLPGDYGTNETAHYPVLYILDGQWDFKLLDSIQGGLHYDGFTPEMLIVGITYSGVNPDYEALRAMDYTTAFHPSLPGSGDAPKFLSFLKEELIPFIETNYRVDASQRVLMGSSFGGLFTLFAMFTEPELFNGYVSASPAVSFAGGVAFAQEAEYASDHEELHARLFLSVGELESLATPVMAMMQTLIERDYTGLELEARIIAGERHAGNKPEAYNRGLRFVFQGK